MQVLKDLCQTNLFPILICILVTNGALHPTGSPVPDRSRYPWQLFGKFPRVFGLRDFCRFGLFVVRFLLMKKSGRKKNWFTKNKKQVQEMLLQHTLSEKATKI